MIKYTSFMKDTIYKFIEFKKISNHWNDSYAQYLKTFENYCLNNYPDTKKLTQEMVDSWCSKRETETNNSCRSRISGIISFLKYTNARNITNLKIPKVPKRIKNTYIPHNFTKEELTYFFYACDHIEFKYTNQNTKNHCLTIPVFFRLLYSSGIRTTEARLLKVSDVDMSNGIININKSKGYNQHYIVLDNSMKTQMIKYNEQISKLYPNRTYFFPAKNDRFHHKEWVSINFKKYWQKYNKVYAIPYDLRHHYAITNINNWIDTGVDFTSKLYYLSKSMGHSTIESTKYYYSLVPRISEIFENQINKSFDNIIPEVKDYE